MPVVLVLEQIAARDLTDRLTADQRIGETGGGQEAQVLLGRENLFRFVRGTGGDDDLGEDLRDLARRVGVERLVQRHDAPESRGAVAIERLLVGVEQRRAPRHARGVGVLDDGDGGTIGGVEFRDQFERRIGVVDVVVGQLFALMLHGGRDAFAGRAVDIESGILMRVLTVAHDLLQLARDHTAARRGFANRGGHPAGHGGVVGPGAGIGDLSLTLAEGISRRAVVGFQLVQQRAVILDIDDGGDEAVVLGRRADHGRAADVDVLDHLVVIRATGQSGLERVEVHDQQVDRADAMLGHRGDVVVVVTQRQQAAVHHRVQRLDTAIHHFGKVRHLGHVLDRNARIPQRLGRSAGGQDLDPHPLQSLAQIDQPGLVGYGNQRAAHGGKVGHVVSLGSVWQLVHLIPHQIAHADGRVLRLGEGPADARRIVYCRAG